MKQEDIKRVWETLSYIVFPAKVIGFLGASFGINWFSEKTGLKPTETSTYGSSEKTQIIEEVMFDLLVRSTLSPENPYYRLTWREAILLTGFRLLLNVFLGFIDYKFLSLIVWSFFLGPIVFLAVPFLFWKGIAGTILSFVMHIELQAAKGFGRRLLAKHALDDQEFWEKCLAAWKDEDSISRTAFDLAYMHKEYERAFTEVCELSLLDPSPDLEFFKDFKEKYFGLEDKLEIYQMAKDFKSSANSEDFKEKYFGLVPKN